MRLQYVYQIVTPPRLSDLLVIFYSIGVVNQELQENLPEWADLQDLHNRLPETLFMSLERELIKLGVRNLVLLKTENIIKIGTPEEHIMTIELIEC